MYGNVGVDRCSFCESLSYWQWFIEWARIRPYISIHQSTNGSSVSVAYYSFIGAFLYWNWFHIILKSQSISTVSQIDWYQNRIIISIEILKQTSFPFNQKTIEIISKRKAFYWRLYYCYWWYFQLYDYPELNYNNIIDTSAIIKSPIKCFLFGKYFSAVLKTTILEHSTHRTKISYLLLFLWTKKQLKYFQTENILLATLLLLLVIFSTIWLSRIKLQ